MRTPKGEMKTSLKKGAWSLEEDRKLISYINRYGIWNWSHMPKFAGLLRSGKSCRLRWMNYLKPDLKKGSFSEEEERSILHFHSILGNRWSAIARKLPGRSDNEIKNYWHTHLKKHVANNPGPKKLMQNKDTSMLPCSEAVHNVEKIQEHHVNDDDDITNFLFSWVSEDDNPSSRSNNISPTSSDQQVEYRDDIGSPGTVEDLQCFWRELLPLDDMEIGDINQEILVLDHIFQDSSYQDPINSWSFYNNNEYEMINNSNNLT